MRDLETVKREIQFLNDTKYAVMARLEVGHWGDTMDWKSGDMFYQAHISVIKIAVCTFINFKRQISKRDFC